MAKPSFDLLHFILNRLPETRYDLASSNLPPVPLKPEALEGLEPVEPHLDGSPELRERIGRLSGVAADQIMVTAGASEANFLVGLALVNRGDPVVVERPTYEPLWKTFQQLGAEVSFPHYDRDVDRLATIAFERHGVLIAPGRLFGDPEPFRLCFGTDTESLKAGLAGLSQAAKEV